MVPDKDTLMLRSFADNAKKVARKNLTTIDYSYATRKSSIVFLLIPEWANTFPPYNLSRLAAITKSAGYRTHVFDVNQVAFNSRHNWDLPFDPWHVAYMPKWFDEEYYKNIHSHLEPILLEYLDKIVDLNPTAVGFTLYDCNREAVSWFIKKLKERLPDVVIIGGGGICNKTQMMLGNYFDYIASGEGEELILEIMAEIEENGKPSEPKIVVQNLNQRINLDDLPIPDYSHFDLNGYEMPNGVAMELSRGCVAKCAFCDETHYWKFRDRMSERVLNEIKTLYEGSGVTMFWFIDSLVNGNLKQFREILRGIIDSNMNISWMGQGRVDKRMDSEFFADIKNSGNMMLSFGVESGSNKVLKDMAKGITAQDIEQNFKDAFDNEVSPGVMLIVGFPTETPQDFYETLCLLWRIRNFNLAYITSGISGCIVAEDTVLGQRPEDFGIAAALFGNNWMTEDLRNTRIHRLIRMKTISIFLEHLVNNQNKDFTYRKLTDYTLEFYDPSKQIEIDYEIFDFDICREKIDNEFASGVFSEIWPLLRIFWRTRGGFKLILPFSQDYDTSEFSNILGCNFNGAFCFEIDDQGNWIANFNCRFIQDETSKWMGNVPPEPDPDKPLSRAKASALRGLRTRTKTIEERWKQYEYFSELDLSFDQEYSASGKWQ